MNRPASPAADGFPGPRTAARVQAIEPFYVMECAKAAARIAATPACDPRQGGERMIYLNIGEPDFTAPPAVQQAACAAIAAGCTAYTEAMGLPALREAISGWYAQRFGVQVGAERILITAGASAGLQLVCLALFEAGDEVLMPDPCYPCNRHFVTAAGARARLLPASAEQRFQMSRAQVEQAWTPATRGVLLASPSNPTGTSIAPEALADIHAAVRARGGVTVVDEIYLGLGYDPRYAASALALGEDLISVNSFSKYFSMTGWRLGWLVLPPALVPAVERLAQNLYICASTVAQHAALACFQPESLAEYERRRAEFKARRDLVVPALDALGLKVPVRPDGAFYAWADVRAHASDSWTFAFELMERAHIALTPGRDFSLHDPAHWLRLSFATSRERLEEALHRLRRVLAG